MAMTWMMKSNLKGLHKILSDGSLWWWWLQRTNWKLLWPCGSAIPS